MMALLLKNSQPQAPVQVQQQLPATLAQLWPLDPRVTAHGLPRLIIPMPPNQAVGRVQQTPYGSQSTLAAHLAGSKATFDRIDRGEIRWDVYGEIQRERMMIHLNWSLLEKGIYPCHHYNAKNGSACDEPDSHTENGFTHRHVCAYCHYATNVLRPHSFKQCTVKKAAAPLPLTPLASPIKRRELPAAQLSAARVVRIRRTTTR